MRTQSDIRAEIDALWAAVFGESAPEGDSNEKLDAVIRAAPPAPYTVLRRYGTTWPYGPGVKS